MPFRYDEQTLEGRDRAVRYLISRNLPLGDRATSEAKLSDVIDRYGPVVESYPHWHPLVASSKNCNRTCPDTTPCASSGYKGLDHTIYLRNAFITCPYDAGERVFESVGKLSACPIASISAEALGFPLYMPNAHPILVTCEWSRPMASDGTIPKSIAVPLLLELEVPEWRNAEVAETWETMRHYILGSPRGSRSSLFVNQDTGQTLKTIWNALINTGMYGPIKVG